MYMFASLRISHADTRTQHIQAYTFTCILACMYARMCVIISYIDACMHMCMYMDVSHHAISAHPISHRIVPRHVG